MVLDAKAGERLPAVVVRADKVASVETTVTVLFEALKVAD